MFKLKTVDFLEKMFIFDPWKTPIPTNLQTPIERIIFLYQKNHQQSTIKIKGPIVPNTKSKRDVWTFQLDINEQYQEIFPELKPGFELTSIHRVKQNEKRGSWPSLKLASLNDPLWNPNKKQWTLPHKCAKIEFIVAYNPYRGKDMVRWAKQILYWLGVEVTSLLDRSHISCNDSPNGEIDLALLRTSMKGQTFYESLGFTLAPEKISNRISNPQKQLHEAWEDLIHEVNWDNLTNTWYKGIDLIKEFQKNMISLEKNIPTINVYFWDQSNNEINTNEEWNEFIEYWHKWGKALHDLHKQYPKTNSPFDIYTKLKEITPHECGDLFNWFLILYQVPLTASYRLFNKTPISIVVNQNEINIPGALNAQKWYFLQRNTEFTTWVATTSYKQNL